MKKSLISSMFFISTIVFGFSANAQDFAFNSKPVAVNPYPETGNKIVSEMDVNIHATRDFKRNFKNATDVKWVKHENGASVYFKNDGLKMRSSYNINGKKEYTLKYYEETKMPSDLRKLVRSNYYDHNIVIVTEVNRHNHTSYLVKMENEKEYLTLKISDEEMTVFEKTNKAK